MGERGGLSAARVALILLLFMFVLFGEVMAAITPSTVPSQRALGVSNRSGCPLGRVMVPTKRCGHLICLFSV